METFQNKLVQSGLNLRRAPLQTLQLNLGRRCNQACRHCHVDAAPWRTEEMSAVTAEKIADWIDRHQPEIVDLTGGAPEIHAPFRFLVQRAQAAGCHVIDRHNLTILEEPGFEDLAEFLAGHGVEIIASLPCYSKENVDQQRGNHVFEKSIRGLQRLNRLGYGTRLPLHLVYNPLGPKLAPSQAELENDYKEVLQREFGIVFHKLYTLNNQPIARFAEDLRRHGRLEEYMTLLVENFNPATVENLMCRSTLSVGYEGDLYDCDFNQMLNLKVPGTARKLWDLDPNNLNGADIVTGPHCFACTAGAGSSCTGALA